MVATKGFVLEDGMEAVANLGDVERANLCLPHIKFTHDRMIAPRTLTAGKAVNGCELIVLTRLTVTRWSVLQCPMY